jgi:hypothetical protein
VARNQLQRTAHIVSDARPPSRTAHQPHLEGGDEKASPDPKCKRLSRKAALLPLRLRMSCCGVVRRRILLWRKLWIPKWRSIWGFRRFNWVLRRSRRRIFDGGRLGISRLRLGIGWSWVLHKRPLRKNARRKAGPWWREGTKTRLPKLLLDARVLLLAPPCDETIRR